MSDPTPLPVRRAAGGGSITVSTVGTVTGGTSLTVQMEDRAATLRAELDALCRADERALHGAVLSALHRAKKVAGNDLCKVGIREEARRLVGALTTSLNTIQALLERGT